jgi:hypothetical protein
MEGFAGREREFMARTPLATMLRQAASVASEASARGTSTDAHSYSAGDATAGSEEAERFSGSAAGS